MGGAAILGRNRHFKAEPPLWGGAAILGRGRHFGGGGKVACLSVRVLQGQCPPGSADCVLAARPQCKDNVWGRKGC